jgi:hypothetical protein
VDLIVCTGCGRPIAQALDGSAKIRGICSACQPNPAEMLRFSVALCAARKASGHKAEYCAARMGVKRAAWYRWENSLKLKPPYKYRDALVALFEGTPAAPIIQEEVRQWPS